MFLMSHSGILLPLLLGCSPLALADTPPGHNEDTHQGLRDDCDYTSYANWRCGNICVNSNDVLCDCGNITLSLELIPRQHCCTSTSCTRSGSRVSCPGGQVRDISEQCEDGRCYGDYISSQYPSYYRSRFSCSGAKKVCLPLHHMCQGLSSCGDSQFCNEKLRCDKRHWGVVTSLNISQVQHSYCQYFRDEGDRSYNNIDRSDENITNIINIKESPKIDYSYLTSCNDSHGDPGVTCFYSTISDTIRCRTVSAWCDSVVSSTCVTSQDGAMTATYDSRLCSNKTFWENIVSDGIDSFLGAD